MGSAGEEGADVVGLGHLCVERRHGAAGSSRVSKSIRA
jgi:hypothetical protein